MTAEHVNLQVVVNEVFLDVFNIKGSMRMWLFIGEHAETINDRGFGLAFGTIQRLCYNDIFASFGRIFDEGKGLYSIKRIKNSLNKKYRKEDITKSDQLKRLMKVRHNRVAHNGVMKVDELTATFNDMDHCLDWFERDFISQLKVQFPTIMTPIPSISCPGMALQQLAIAAGIIPHPYSAALTVAD